ncbi:MAG: ParB/RepB/Spo0J family partition protein [Thermodesulfobacteriota bacterium]
MRSWPSDMVHMGNDGIKNQREYTEMDRIFSKIRIDAIDSRDHFFSMTFHPNLECLRRSIGRAGLLQPIIVREKSKGSRYQVMSGFKRLNACKQLGLKTIEAFSYRKSELSDLECFHIALHENLTTRGFNLIEKSMVLHKLIHQFGLPKGSVARDYMPMVGLQPNPRILEKVSQVVGLRVGVKRYIVEEEVSLGNATQFLEFAAEDQTEIGRLISELKLGENTLKEVLSLLREVSLRDGLKVRELVKGELEGIVSDATSSRVHKTSRVRRRLQEMRYPRLTELEKAFHEKRKGLGLSPGISLHHPSYFEGDRLRVEFRFGNVGEFKAIISKLIQASERKELGEMLELAL